MRWEWQMITDNNTILYNADIREALVKIDRNNKGFLIVVDENGVVVGVMTDGDIRRLLIQGESLASRISYTEEFAKISLHDDFATICSIFKSKKIDFVPIVNDGGQLHDILTKREFHVLLLQDYTFVWDNLPEIDETVLDHEIYNRPWGFYKTTLYSEYAQAKVITLFPDSELSLQEHKKREEHWVVIKGEGRVVLGESELEIFPGRYIYIPKGCKHQLINTSPTANLIVSEVQLGDYFGEDDIIRYQDKYDRM
jgi:mannose-1-phosphate guanylyltransferase/mannose-6-phosphate isomerase